MQVGKFYERAQVIGRQNKRKLEKPADFSDLTPLKIGKIMKCASGHLAVFALRLLFIQAGHHVLHTNMMPQPAERT